MSVDNKIEKTPSFSGDAQKALDTMFNVLTDPEQSAIRKTINPEVTSLWDNESDQSMELLVRVTSLHFTKSNRFPAIVAELNEHILAFPKKSEEKKEVEVVKTNDVETSTTEETVPEKPKAVSPTENTEKENPKSEASSDLKEVIILNEEGKEIILQANQVVTLADYELHNFITNALIQRNTITSPEVSYRITNIYKGNSSKEKDLVLIDMKLPIREGVRTAEEAKKAITISNIELARKETPQSFSIDGMLIAKQAVLSKDLVNTVNYLAESKNVQANDWKVENIFTGNKGDVMLHLESSDGKKFAVAADRLEKSHLDYKINHVKQTPLSPEKLETLHDFFNENYKPEIAYLNKKAADFEEKEKAAEELKKKQAGEKDVPTEEATTSDSTVVLLDKEPDEASIKKNKEVTETAVDPTPTTKKEVSAEKTETKIETTAPSANELLAGVLNTDLENYIQKKLSAVLPGFEIKIPKDDVENLSMNLRYSHNESVVTATVKIPNGDSSVVLSSKHITLNLTHNESPSVTEGADVEKEKAFITEALTNIFSKVLEDRDGIDPEKSILKVKHGQLTIYSK